MFESILEFEQDAAVLNPAVFIVPGLIAVWLGLFLWLGGLRFRKVLLAVVFAMFGFVCGFFLIGKHPISAVALAVAAGGVAAMFDKIFITIMAASLVVVLSFAASASPYLPEKTVPQKVYYKGEPLDLEQTFDNINRYATDFSVELKQLCQQIPRYSWAIITALAVISIAAGFFFWRLVCAFSCAGWGVLLIFFGMILLLLYKGAEPVTRIVARGSFYLSVFAAMIAFGAVEQLLLYKYTLKKRKYEEEEESEKKGSSWRNR